MRNGNGGVAIGYDYTPNGLIDRSKCGGYLWSTGEELRVSHDPALAAQLAAGGPADVNGLQGNGIELVRPQNVPPLRTYFIDYDDMYDDAASRGHMGDVAIYRVCGPRVGIPGLPAIGIPLLPPPLLCVPGTTQQPGYQCCPDGTSMNASGQCVSWCPPGIDPNGSTSGIPNRQLCAHGFDPTTVDSNNPQNLRCIGGAKPIATGGGGTYGCLDYSLAYNPPVCASGYTKGTVGQGGVPGLPPTGNPVLDNEQVCVPNQQQQNCATGQQVGFDGQCHVLCPNGGTAYPLTPPTAGQCCPDGSIVTSTGYCCPPGATIDPTTGKCGPPQPCVPTPVPIPGQPNLCCPPGATLEGRAGGPPNYCCVPGAGGVPQCSLAQPCPPTQPGIPGLCCPAGFTAQQQGSVIACCSPTECLLQPPKPCPPQTGNCCPAGTVPNPVTGGCCPPGTTPDPQTGSCGKLPCPPQPVPIPGKQDQCCPPGSTPLPNGQCCKGGRPVYDKGRRGGATGRDMLARLSEMLSRESVIKTGLVPGTCNGQIVPPQTCGPPPTDGNCCPDGTTYNPQTGQCQPTVGQCPPQPVPIPGRPSFCCPADFTPRTEGGKIICCPPGRTGPDNPCQEPQHCPPPPPPGSCCPDGTTYNPQTGQCQPTVGQCPPQGVPVPGRPGFCCPPDTPGTPGVGATICIPSGDPPTPCPPPPPPGSCCPDGTTYNPKTGSCTPIETPRCPPGSTPNPIRGGCCPGGTQLNQIGLCIPLTPTCPPNLRDSRGQCCQEGRLSKPGGQCCALDQVPNPYTGQCCPVGQVPLPTGCCPPGQAAGTTCCPPGTQPGGGDNRFCVSSGCPSGTTPDPKTGICCTSAPAAVPSCGCPPGQILIRGKCSPRGTHAPPPPPPPPPPTGVPPLVGPPLLPTPSPCHAGQHLRGDRCVCDNTGQPPSAVSGQCVTQRPTCPPGAVSFGASTQCICRNGKPPVGGSCYTKPPPTLHCRAGERPEGGRCVTIPSKLRCGAGQRPVGGHCVSVEHKPKPGITPPKRTRTPTVTPPKKTPPPKRTPTRRSTTTTIR